MLKPIMTAEEAVKLVKDKVTLCVDGFAGAGYPENLLIALEKRFLEEGHPQDITLVMFGQGDARGGGLDHLAHEGLVKKLIASYFGLNRKLGSWVLEDKIEAYILPGGLIGQLCREAAGGRPGLITHIGLRTKLDPRIKGAGATSLAKEERVKLLIIDGEEYLFYKAPSIDVAFLKATTSDELGNLSMEKEPSFYCALPMAQAAHRNNGIVIAQVERVAKARTLKAKSVKVPGMLVDSIVIAKPEYHMQTAKVLYNPAWSGEIRVSQQVISRVDFLNERVIIGRRAALELRKGAIVNIGVGTPEFVSQISRDEGVSEQITLTIEDGPIGGVPEYGLNFGVSTNPDAILDLISPFDFYEGGGIDISFVGFGEIDKLGNVNVSKLKGRYPGIGGFIHVTQPSKKVVFCGTFTAKNLEVEVGEGRIRILNEGKIRKFVDHVGEITFSGKYASERGKPVLVVTERAVFELRKKGLVLIEIAPGINLEKHILDQMDFEPIIAKDLKEIHPEIFMENLSNKSFHNLNLKEKFRESLR